MFFRNSREEIDQIINNCGEIYFKERNSDFYEGLSSVHQFSSRSTIQGYYYNFFIKTVNCLEIDFQ